MGEAYQHKKPRSPVFLNISGSRLDNQNVAFYHQYDHFSYNFYWELKSEANKNNEWSIISLEKILYPYWQYGVGMGIAGNSGVLIDAVFDYKLGAMP